MIHFTLVTGNPHKAMEFKRLLPPDFGFEITDLDLDEIQSLDLRVIIEHKVRQAYDMIRKPVVVEDVAAGLNKMNGLPGPFIKFFEQQLGKDALYQLAGKPSTATITSTIGYFDGTNLLFAQGLAHGIVTSAQGGNGFGFDSCFVPNGQTRTFAEMSPAEKDAISHRTRAVHDLLEQLKNL